MSLDAYNTKLEKIIKSSRQNNQSENLDQSIPDDFLAFNDLMGLPLHPSTGQPTPLMPYQLGFINEIPRGRNCRFLINKSRQIGVTELILRVLAFNCFFKYKGKKVIILAGNGTKTVADIMRRLMQLFQNISWSVLEYNNSTIKLANGTEIIPK